MSTEIAIRSSESVVAETDAFINGLIDDAVVALDPVEFVRRAGFEPHDYQIAVLRSRSKRIILNWSRQAGKSTVTSWLPLHRAIYYPGSTVLILGPGERQAKLLLDKVYDALDTIGRDAIPVEEDNILELRLENGSKIVALPGKEGTVRGYTADLIVIDEASKVADLLYKAVRPMVAATNGTIVLLGTPFGKRGFFYETFVARNTRWDRHEVKADRVPHISAEFLAEELQEIGRVWFEQEYMCHFIDLVGSVFSLDEIMRAMEDTTVAPLFAIPGIGSPVTDAAIEPLPFAF